MKLMMCLKVPMMTIHVYKGFPFKKIEKITNLKMNLFCAFSVMQIFIQNVKLYCIKFVSIL